MSFTYSGRSVSYRRRGNGVTLPPVEEDPLKPMRKAFGEYLGQVRDMTAEDEILSELSAAQTTGLVIPSVQAAREASSTEGDKAEDTGIHEETFLEAYKSISPVEAAEKLRASRYVRFAEAGLEDAAFQFSTFEDLLYYLRSQCGLELDYSLPGVVQKKNTNELNLRFVSHEVQKSELEHRALGIGRRDLAKFWGDEEESQSAQTEEQREKEVTTRVGEDECLKALFQAETDDDMCSVLEDYGKVIICIENLQIKSWRLEYSL